MRISVIIPCHGGVDDTRACLRSLLESELPAAAALEVLVVDNASPDAGATARLSDDFPGRIRVLALESNRGFAGGVNAGLRAVADGATHLLVLNNDTLVAPRMIARLSEAVDADPRIAMAAPVSNRVKGPARLPIGDAGLDPADRREIEAILHEDTRRIQDVQTLSGLCLMMRRPWADRIGGFDELFGFGNWEDDDYSLRARLLGGRLVLVRNAFLHHHGSRTFAALGLDLREQILARRADFAAKWRDDPAGRTYLALADGDLDAAARFAERGLRERPRWIDGPAVCARAALARGEAARARALAESYLRDCPFDGEVALVLARAELADGAVERGLDSFRRALSTCWFGPERMAVALCHLVDYWFQRQEPDRAWPFLEEALGILPDDGGLLNRLGIFYLYKQKNAEAAEAFRRAAAAGDREAALNHGIALCRAGDEPGARAVWQSVATGTDEVLAARARDLLDGGAATRSA